MAVSGAVIAAKQSGAHPLKRARAYVKAHWKELLALVLAAIPALFLVFHAGARKQALTTLSLAPLGTATPGGADPGSAIVPPAAVVPSNPVAAAIDRSVNPSPAPPKPTSRGANPSPAPHLGGDQHGLPVSDGPPQSINGSNPISVPAPDTSSGWTTILVKRVPSRGSNPS